MFQNKITKLNKQVTLFGLVLFLLSFNPPLALSSSRLYVETGNLLPNSGSVSINQAITFTSTFYDSINRWDIEYVRFMVNTSSTSFKNCLYAIYSSLLNKFYLLGDDGKTYLGGFSPGSNKIIQNSYCLLDCSKSTVSGSGNILTVKWAVSFKSKFTGTKNLYLYVKGLLSGYDGWDKKGTVTIASEVSDKTPPTGSVKINNDSSYANSTSVILNLSAIDNTGGSGVSQMQFSNDNITWTSPETYAANKPYTLTPGDGPKTVYVKYKDVAGNWSSVYSDTIVLDTVTPQISIISPLDNEIVRPK